MSKKEMDASTHVTFEEIRRFDKEDNEYWLARELAPLLDYRKWQNFSLVIEKANSLRPVRQTDCRPFR